MQRPIYRVLQKLSWGALGITLILIPFRYRFLQFARPVEPIWGDYTDFLIFASDVFMGATILFWLFSLNAKPRKINIGPYFLTYPLIGIIGMAALSILSSIDQALSIYHTFRLLLLGGFYLFVVNEIKTIDQVIFPVAGQLAIQSIVGIAQVLEQKSLGLQMLGEYDLNPTWQGVSIVWAEGERLLRAYGLTDHPNILGGCLAFGTLLIITWFISHKLNWRLLVGGVAGLSVIGLLLTYSRTAWLAFATGIGLMGFLLIKSGRFRDLRELRSIVFFSVLITAPFLWTNIGPLGIRLGRGNAFQEIPGEIAAIGERQALNSAVTDIFTDNPILGVGVGTMPQAIKDKYPLFPTDYQPAHNVMLNVVGETGLLAGMFYAIMIISPWLALLVNRSIHLTPEMIGISGVLLATTIVGLFDYYTWLLVPGRLWQWLVLGLWAAIYQNSKRV